MNLRLVFFKKISALVIIFLSLAFVIFYKKHSFKNVSEAAFFAVSAKSAKNIPPIETDVGRVVDSDIAAINAITFQKSFPSEEKVFQIASISKTFAAVSLVKMTSDQNYARFFDEKDPLGTSISHFEKLIFKHKNRLQQRYFLELKKNHTRYAEITLRHLLNHSSGIVDDTAEFLELHKFRSDQTQKLAPEFTYHPLKIDVRNFGKMSYCNISFDAVLLPIIEAIASEARGKKVRFAEIVKEQIILPLGLTKTFMSDEAKYDAETNQVYIEKHPEIKVAQGYDYFAGKVTADQDFNYETAAGGIHASASDIAKFYYAILSEEIFDEVSKQRFFDPQNFAASGGGYGLGIGRSQFGDIEYFSHGGVGTGFFAHVIGQRKIAASEDREIKVGVAMLSYENLTKPIAEALLGEKKKSFSNKELLKKMNELSLIHSQNELIELRMELDLIATQHKKKDQGVSH